MENEEKKTSNKKFILIGGLSFGLIILLLAMRKKPELKQVVKEKEDKPIIINNYIEKPIKKEKKETVKNEITPPIKKDEIIVKLED